MERDRAYFILKPPALNLWIFFHTHKGVAHWVHYVDTVLLYSEIYISALSAADLFFFINGNCVNKLSRFSLVEYRPTNH